MGLIELEKLAKEFCDSIEVEGSIGHVHTAMANFVLWLQSANTRTVEDAWLDVWGEWERVGLKPGALTSFKAGFSKGRSLYDPEQVEGVR